MASEEFTLYISTLKQHLSDLQAGSCDDYEATYAEAQALLKDAGLEARMAEKDEKKTMLAQVDELKKAILKAKQSLDTANLRGGDGSNSKSAQDRQRMETANDKLARQNDAILAATRSVNETEQVGADIVNELSSNREKIESSRNKTSELKSITDDASIRIDRMQKRDNCVVC
jgi:hypothetical protein